MAEELLELFEKFKYIKDYLTKLGPSKRTARIKKEKNAEANKLKKQFDIILGKVHSSSKTRIFEKTELENIENLSSKISSYYLKIKQLCELSIEKDSSSVGTVVQKNANMEKFELKTAISLLPVMDNTETVTKQLISNIEMYSDMLDVADREKLINFVLKSRLSESAKLRLGEAYESITDLVKDMRSRLLSKKSDTALQQQLQRARQDKESVEDFGKHIEKLFVDLTITQADGDAKKYEILKSVNERNAIKRFTDGLRNSRISTIIAARNYGSLNDAIRGALDEEISSSSESRDTVMNFYQGRGRGRSNNFYPSNYFRGRRSSSSGFSRGQRTPNQSESLRDPTNSRAGNNNYRSSGRYTRSFYNNTNRCQISRQQIHAAEVNNSSNDQNSVDNSDSQNYFFRA